MSAARLVGVDDTGLTVGRSAAPCVLVVGNFDGVHLGHQAVLREAVAYARSAGLAACVLTFDPHPAAVVGVGAPPLLTTLERRAELACEIGIECVYVRRFDVAFAAWQPGQFAKELVVRALQARVVVVGENFRFGARRTGDLTLLRTLGQELGFEVKVSAVAADDRGPYSSTRAREAVSTGNLYEVGRVLGRPHALTGSVVHGVERGRTIGVPTANLEAPAELLPPNGVYAVLVERLGGAPSAVALLGPGVTNIGVRPTMGISSRVSVETHLIDFSGDLYDAQLRLRLVARLRDEAKFASLDELKAQIGLDIAHARSALGEA